MFGLSRFWSRVSRVFCGLKGRLRVVFFGRLGFLGVGFYCVSLEFTLGD